MPSRFISLTTSTPNALSPPALACSFHLEFSSRPRRRPSQGRHWRRQREVAAAEPVVHPKGSRRDPLIWWPPSNPAIDASLPSLTMRRTSAAVHANSRSSGYFSHNLWTQSICSRVFCTCLAAADRRRDDGDQNCAVRPVPAATTCAVLVAQFRYFNVPVCVCGCDHGQIKIREAVVRSRVVQRLRAPGMSSVVRAAPCSHPSRRVRRVVQAARALSAPRRSRSSSTLARPRGCVMSPWTRGTPRRTCPACRRGCVVACTAVRPPAPAIGLELALHLGTLAGMICSCAHRWRSESSCRVSAQSHGAAAVSRRQRAAWFGTSFARLRCRLHAAYTTYRPTASPQ